MPLRFIAVNRRVRGAALLVSGTFVAIGALLPWITITWLGSNRQSGYGPFESQVLGPIPGIVALLVAATLVAIGTCDLQNLLTLGTRSWHTKACIVGFILVGFGIVTDTLWENRTAGGNGQGILWVTQATGAWLAGWGVGIGILACCLSGLRATRASSRLRDSETLETK
jgi:hypothetical protein